jgi:hypothetical protein
MAASTSARSRRFTPARGRGFSTVVGHRPEGVLRETLTNGAHLAVLSALALAQPVFDILGRNATFFAVRGSSSTEIVLFAVALILLPPAVLVLVELAAAAFSRTLARALHLVFVAGLVALLALSVLTKTDAISGAVAIAASVLVGAAAALVYRLAGAARSVLTVLAPVPLIFLGLFLIHSPVSKLVFVDEPEVQAATVRARTPVVLIIFDELSTIGLMNRRQRIDARRWPNFASLARDSTWFRSGSTVYWLTEHAVPPILTGQMPQTGKLPVFAEYPNSIFTLLGGSYRMRVVETLTHLCPRKYCRDTSLSQTQTVPGGVRSLASDAGIVYLHLLLPEPYVDRIPPISDAWGDFGGQAEHEEPVHRSASGEIEACGRNVCQFTDLISADRKPTFYFLHTSLPHVPYVYLPSGRRYAVDLRPLHGLENGFTTDWAALQGQQRYLLQLGYTDRALGQMLERLRSTGVFDRALVIVTADHGVSYRRGVLRRFPAPSNLEDIAFVPLFVKLPGQRKGRIDDSLARSIDIVPTIARVLGLPLRWRVDGRPLVGRRLPSDGTVSVLKPDGSPVSARLSELRTRRSRSHARQLAAFGTGSLATVYRIGPHRELLGRRSSELSVRPSSATVELDGRTLLDAVDPDSGFLPSYLEGKIQGKLEPEQPLAIAVNGRIAAVTRTFEQYGETKFTAFVPEESLLPGKNAVDVFVVRRAGRSPVLMQLRGSDLSFTLRERDGREVIESTGGGSIRVEPGALRGTVRVEARGNDFVFSGTATHARTRSQATRLGLFVDDRAVFWARAASLKPHRILGQPDLGKFGFVFELPRSLLPGSGGVQRVRLFAVRHGVASELRYAVGYPWAHK